MNRMPDNPTPISLDMLRGLDAETPGTWIAQPKLDGWRVVADNIDGQWRYTSKPGHPAALPATLRLDFETLPWPKGLALDCEWMGKRAQAGQHRLHVFDVLALDGLWCVMPFNARAGLLIDLQVAVWQDALSPGERSTHSVQFMPCWLNPGLGERFAEQMQDPASEGLVVRHQHSRLIGAYGRCANNPLMFKCKFAPLKESSPHIH